MTTETENRETLISTLSTTPLLADKLLDRLSDNNIFPDDLEENIIRELCSEYEKTMNYRIEENDMIINQLKKNLYELTEKRMRSNYNKINNENNNYELSNEDNVANITTLNNTMQLIINDKDAQIEKLLSEIDELNYEKSKLKETIKQQDNVILEHNNTIYVKLLLLIYIFFFYKFL